LLFGGRATSSDDVPNINKKTASHIRLELKTGKTRKGHALSADARAKKEKQLKAYEDSLTLKDTVNSRSDDLAEKLDTLKAELKQDVYEVISGQYVPPAEQRGTTQHQIAARTTSATFHSNAAKVLKEKSIVEESVQKLAQVSPEKAEELAKSLEDETEERLGFLGTKHLAATQKQQRGVEAQEKKQQKAQEKEAKKKTADQKKKEAQAKKMAKEAEKKRKQAEKEKKKAEEEAKQREEAEEAEEAEEEEAEEDETVEPEEVSTVSALTQQLREMKAQNRELFAKHVNFFKRSRSKELRAACRNPTKTPEEKQVAKQNYAEYKKTFSEATAAWETHRNEMYKVAEELKSLTGQFPMWLFEIPAEETKAEEDTDEQEAEGTLGAATGSVQVEEEEEDEQEDSEATLGAETGSVTAEEAEEAAKHTVPLPNVADLAGFLESQTADDMIPDFAKFTMQQLCDYGGKAKLTFGKHAGQTYLEVAKSQPDYCKWLSTLKQNLNVRYFSCWYVSFQTAGSVTAKEATASKEVN
jgi:hypothetical protein